MRSAQKLAYSHVIVAVLARVRPSDIPITMSRTVSEAVKCFSTCGVCGMGIFSAWYVNHLTREHFMLSGERVCTSCSRRRCLSPKSRLKQNAGRQVASLPDMTIGGNLSITGDFFQPSTKIIHRNVHGSRYVARSKFLRRANVQ
jgi:hypothetical protein